MKWNFFQGASTDIQVYLDMSDGFVAKNLSDLSKSELTETEINKEKIKINSNFVNTGALASSIHFLPFIASTWKS